METERSLSVDFKIGAAIWALLDPLLLVLSDVPSNMVLVPVALLLFFYCNYDKTAKAFSY